MAILVHSTLGAGTSFESRILDNYQHDGRGTPALLALM